MNLTNEPAQPGHTSAPLRPKIAILSSVHLALDNRVFYRQARTLQRAGYDVTLIAVHDRDEMKDGVQIIALPAVRRWQRPLVWQRLLRYALRTEAEVFHFHDPELLLVAPLLKLFTRRPTIYDIHEAYGDFVEVKDYLPSFLRRPLADLVRRLEPHLAGMQDGLIFADDEIAAAFADLDRPKATLFNFPGRSLLEKAAPVSGNVEKRGAVVLYLGGMERNRGSALMLEAFQQALRRLPGARLLVVGHFTPPELEQEVRADAAARGIEHAVTITGRVPFEQIGHYLQQARVGWVTWQPFLKNEKNIPTKLFEYMAHALPIVSSDLRSTRQFVQHGVNGLLVKADDPVAHADALLRFLEDPFLAAEVGRAGQYLVQTEYNWGVMEPKLLQLYRQVRAG